MRSVQDNVCALCDALSVHSRHLKKIRAANLAVVVVTIVTTTVSIITIIIFDPRPAWPQQLPKGQNLGSNSPEIYRMFRIQRAKCKHVARPVEAPWGCSCPDAEGQASFTVSQVRLEEACTFRPGSTTFRLRPV